MDRTVECETIPKISIPLIVLCVKLKFTYSLAAFFTFSVLFSRWKPLHISPLMNILYTYIHSSMQVVIEQLVSSPQIINPVIAALQITIGSNKMCSQTRNLNLFQQTSHFLIYLYMDSLHCFINPADVHRCSVESLMIHSRSKWEGALFCKA